MGHDGLFNLNMFENLNNLQRDKRRVQNRAGFLTNYQPKSGTNHIFLEKCDPKPAQLAFTYTSYLALKMMKIVG